VICGIYLCCLYVELEVSAIVLSGLTGVYLATADEALRDSLVQGEVNQDHQLDGIFHLIALGIFYGT
jgi:hypothetical protein